MPDDERFPRLSGSTRSTLRMGPLGLPPGAGDAPAAPRPQEHVLLLPLRLGVHRLALEATRVVEVMPGGAWTGAPDPERPVASADLYRTFGVLAPEDRETIVARADGQLGRGPGRFVAFAVDRAERLVKAPLENLSPLPAIAREQIQVDFIAGVVTLPYPDDGMAFLLDPMKLAASAASAEEVP